MNIPENPYTFGLVIAFANNWEQQTADNKAASDIWEACSKAWAKLLLSRPEMCEVLKTDDYNALKRLGGGKVDG